MYKTLGYLFLAVLTTYVLAFHVLNPYVFVPGRLEKLDNVIKDIPKSLRPLDRECSVTEYQTLRYAIVDYPMLKPIAAKYLEDGCLTRAEYIDLQTIWTQEHKKQIVEGLKDEISGESKGWRTRFYSDGLCPD